MRLSSMNWFKENFGLTATSLGFTLDVITLTALINSKVPPSIPFIDHPLDQKTQATILVLAGLTYLGFLQEYRTQVRKNCAYESSHTFLGFLVRDMILFLDHPFLLLPAVILIGFSWIIFPGFWSVTSIVILACIFFLALVLLAIYIENMLEGQEQQEIWAKPSQNNLGLYDSLTKEFHTTRAPKKLSNCWMQRIERELDKEKYVSDYDLAKMHSCSRSIVRKAFRAYLKEYESKKQLVLTKEKMKKTGANVIHLLILCPRSSLDSEPWLKLVS